MLNTGGSQSVCPYSQQQRQDRSTCTYSQKSPFPLLFNERSTRSYVVYYDVSHCIIDDLSSVA